MAEALTQEAPIDVANWLADEEYSRYPEGSRPKRALFPPEDHGLDFIRPARRYLFKQSARRYPDQFWHEVVGYQAGCRLSVEVPPAFAAFNSKTGVCGALIEWFYQDGLQRYVPGGNFLQALMPDYDRDRGIQHNFQAVKVVCRGLARVGHDAEWPSFWGNAFLFDALIGNTDRHQDNWGYVFAADAHGKLQGQLGPLFDNGTSLGHERYMEHVAGWDDARYAKYVGRGTHHMKWSLEDEKGCPHIEMVSRMIAEHPTLKEGLRERLHGFSNDAIAEVIAQLQELELPIKLSPERGAFMRRLIGMRHAALAAVLV